MIKVKSRQTTTLIARRFMARNRGRNFIAVVAIILTTVLFTSLFTAAASVLKSQQTQEIRTAMNQSHFSVSGISSEKLAQLVSDDSVKACGSNRFLGTVDSGPLAGSSAVLRWTDSKGASAMFCAPTKGRLPRSEDEVAMSSITLDQLGLSHALGTEVHLQYSTGTQSREGDFVLCGTWSGDPLAAEQEIWVSESYCGTYAEGEVFSAYLWFDSPLHLWEQGDALAESYGLLEDGVSFAVNSAYDYFSGDGMRLDLLAAVLLIIFAAGYLIIYNVFRISVGSDIRTYGLLMNIGTTGKQLKAVVRRQAMILSLAGIPLGLFLGWFAGRTMTPYLLEKGDGVMTDPVYSAHPLIFLVSGTFAALTVYAGCQMPARIVSKLTPAEAVRMDFDSWSGGVSRGTGRPTPFFMALAGFRRGWKRAVLVVLSLALPLVLLNSAYSVAKSYDYDQFLRVYSSYDFQVSGLTGNLQTSDLQGVTPKLIRDLASREEVEQLGLVYETDILHTLDDRGYANLKSILQKAEEAEYLAAYQMEPEWEALESRQVKAHVMGLSEAAFAKMQFLEGSFDYEDLSSGDYVVVSDLVQGFGTYYDPGDQVTLALPGGGTKTYTVLAVGWMPYDLGYRYVESSFFACTYFLPEEEYLRMGGGEKAMLAGVDVREGCEEAFEQWLTERIGAEEKTLYVESQLDALRACKTFSQKNSVILAILSGVLFFIGVLNFFNTTSVSILARRRELTLLEAIGMTRRQIISMLSAEGLLYLAAALILADTVGMAAANPLIVDTVGRTFYFDYEMDLTMSLAAAPLMAALAVLIPRYHYRRLRKETVADRFQDV